MTYIEGMRDFSKAAFVDERITASEVFVFLALYDIANELNFQKWFGCADRRLMLMTSLSKATITKAKNRLKQTGWIDFKGDPKTTTMYTICHPSALETGSHFRADHRADTRADRRADHRADTRADRRALNRLDKTRGDEIKKTSKEKAVAFSLDSYTDNEELAEALRGYIDMRKKGKTFTDRALKLALNELSRLAANDADKIAIVNQTVMNGWKGFFPLKTGRKEHRDARRNTDCRPLEEQYADFFEADKNHVHPWEV